MKRGDPEDDDDGNEVADQRCICLQRRDRAHQQPDHGQGDDQREGDQAERLEAEQVEPVHPVLLQSDLLGKDVAVPQHVRLELSDARSGERLVAAVGQGNLQAHDPERGNEIRRGQARPPEPTKESETGQFVGYGRVLAGDHR